jgi:hypothetical protein
LERNPTIRPQSANVEPFGVIDLDPASNDLAQETDELARSAEQNRTGLESRLTTCQWVACHCV